MGTLGGILRATGGRPQFSTVSSVKNPALAGNINNAISGYGAAANAGDSALSDYISRYMGGRGAAENRSNQEIGAVDQFYNGAMSNQLAQLRQQRSKAVTDAANVASSQAIANQNRSRVGGSGGTGSYDTRLTMANLTPIRTAAALDDANQARADLGYVTQNELGLAGKRNEMANQQEGYGLVPEATRMQMLGGRAAYLSSLGNLDQQNTFYGLQQKPNVGADIADSVDQGILNAAAIYSSVGGGAGGMRRGGLVRGPGTETSDSIPARLSKGEFVVPAEAMHIPGMLPLLERIRHLALMHRIHVRGFADGGPVIDVHAAVSPWGRPLMYRDGGYVMRYARGGPVMGYQDGGMPDWGGIDIGSGVPYTPEPEATSSNWDFGGGGGNDDPFNPPGKPKAQKSAGGGGGGGGGGLAGSAQQLGARAMADLTPQWTGATIIGNTGGGGGVSVGPMGGGGGGRMLTPQQTIPLPPAADTSRNDYFRPENYDQITPQWRDYGNAWSRYYNDPKSAGYVAPGTYE